MKKKKVCCLDTQLFPFCRVAAQTNVVVKSCDVGCSDHSGLLLQVCTVTAGGGGGGGRDGAGGEEEKEEVFCLFLCQSHIWQVEARCFIKG